MTTETTETIEPPVLNHPAATPLPAYKVGHKVTILEGRDRIRLSDGREIAISYWRKNAPPIICDPTGKINGGRPTSVYDLMYAHSYQSLSLPLTPKEHAVPQDWSRAGQDDWTLLAPTEFRIVKRGELKKMDEATAQPGPRTDIPLDDVAAMRKEYWGGNTGATLASLAVKHGVSVPTIRKYVYGGLAWYA